MTTALKGNTTEAAVLRALVERDFAVLLPFGEGHPYDLVVHLRHDRFARVQCKTGRAREGRLMFNSRSTDHGHGAGSYLGLADLFGVYCAQKSSVYLLPVRELPTSRVYLRLAPTRNNQRRGIRFACDYEIERWTAERLETLVSRDEFGSGRPQLKIVEAGPG